MRPADSSGVRTLAALAVVAGAWGATPARADDPHRHDRQVQTAPQPVISGTRWATDAPLRQGMTRIRALTAPWTTRTDRPGETDAVDARATAAAIRAQVQFLIDHCRLEPQADAALHELIADILRGADALSLPARRGEGVAMIQAALQRYPKTFDHPGWEPLPVP